MPGSIFASLKTSSLKSKSCAPAQHRCEELSTRLHAYTFRQRLGRGAFGQVYLAEVDDESMSRFSRENRGKLLVAVKVIRRTKLEKESTRALARAEAENLRRISATKSLFFTQLRETFSDAHNLYIVTDFLQGGTLRKEMNRYYRMGKVIPTDRIVLIMAQLVEALAQIRDLRIVHRDIKPDNMLLDSLGNVVLADFGLSRWFEIAASEDDFEHDAGDVQGTGRRVIMCNSHLSIFKSWREKDRRKSADDASGSRSEVTREGEISSTGADKSCMTDTGCGTLAYAAPEMHRGEAYSFSADIYSLGVVFHEMLLDRLPPYPPTEAECVHKDNEDWFLDASKKSAQELTIDRVSLHLLKSLLALDPSKRISIPELRTHSFFSGVHWHTLAAQAYTLPDYHSAPSLPLKLLPYSGVINPGVFVDPLAVPEDGPDRALDETFNVEGCLKMRRRPDGKHKRWKSTRIGKEMLGVPEKTLQVWNFVTGRDRRTKKREWAGDVGYRRETFARVTEFKTNNQSRRDVAGENDAGKEIEAVVQTEDLASSHSRDSVVASTGHGSSTSHESAAVRRTSPEPQYPRRLRRVIALIPPRPRPVPSVQMHTPSPTLNLLLEQSSNASPGSNSDSDISSTIAIFARSFLEPESDHELEAQAASRRTRPGLARLSTDLPISSPEGSQSSSSPFPSSYSLGVFLSRAFDHVLPSTLSVISPSAVARAEDKLRAKLMPLSSSCPSLLPSSSLAPSAISSVLPTPERGNSRLSGMVNNCEGGVNIIKRVGVAEVREMGLIEKYSCDRDNEE
ncbi:hypothetical protein ACEPAH_7507 [Sanghuangporus vaninii]